MSKLRSERRLRAVVNTRTPGLAGARNSGGLAASGDLLAFLDDDDEWLPDKLRLQVEVLKRTPDAVVVGCGIFVRWNGRLIARVPPNRPMMFQDLLAAHRRIPSINSSNVLFRRATSSSLSRLGSTNARPGSYSEDYEWLLRAARVGPIAVVPRPLATINWSASSYFSGRWEMIASALSSLLERYPEFHEVPRGLARVQGQIAFALAGAGQRRRGALAWVRRCAKSHWREPRAYLAAAVVVGLPADLVLRALHRTGRGSRHGDRGVAPPRPRGSSRAWPLYALFAGFPVWWLFGLGAFIWPIVAVPMLLSLIVRREVRVPPAFALWALFLAWMLASGLMLDEPQRLLVFIYRASLYFSATILFLYVYNASPESLPASVVARILAVFGGFVVVGGFLGMVFASASLSTPVEAAMSVIPGICFPTTGSKLRCTLTFANVPTPSSLPPPTSVGAVPLRERMGRELHPAGAVPHPRGHPVGDHPCPWLARFVLIASIVPLIVSVNRGAWIALAACLVYAAVRLAARGRSRALVSVLLVVIAFAGVILLTPLRGVVEDRIVR